MWGEHCNGKILIFARACVSQGRHSLRHSRDEIQFGKCWISNGLRVWPCKQTQWFYISYQSSVSGSSFKVESVQLLHLLRKLPIDSDSPSTRLRQLSSDLTCSLQTCSTFPCWAPFHFFISLHHIQYHQHIKECGSRSFTHRHLFSLSN